MNWKDLVVWFAQWAILEVSKKWPKIGAFVKNNAPAVLAVLSIIVGLLEKIIAPGIAHAQTAPVGPSPADSSAIGPIVTNYVGTIVVDNVLRKIVWHWLFGKVFGVSAAKKK